MQPKSSLPSPDGDGSACGGGGVRARVHAARTPNPEPGTRNSEPGTQNPEGELYLISTFAPASSNFFLIAAASSFVTPSLIGFGAASTRSLASFSPRLVTSRTALI